MTLFTIIFMLLFGAPAAGLAWYLARRYPSWRKRRVVLLAVMPAPSLVVVAGAASIFYGAYIAAGTCGYEDCGGFILIGIMGISAAIGAWFVGLAFAVIGALLGRRTETPVPPKVGEVFD